MLSPVRVLAAKLRDSFRMACDIKDLKLLRNPDECFNGCAHTLLGSAFTKSGP
jgi:hypothetical protein